MRRGGTKAVRPRCALMRAGLRRKVVAMRITDGSHAGELEELAELAYVRLAPDGAAERRTDQLQAENALRVYVNGELTMTLVCSPSNIPELVLGRLFTEGMIAGTEDVEEISICEHATRAIVTLHDRTADYSRKSSLTVASCCTFNSTLNGYFIIDEELSKVTPKPWDPAWIFQMAELFERDTPVHRTTMGAHSCYLALEHEVLYCCEDLGRHNAFDKVIGRALEDGVDLTRCTVFTSGRIPTDMVVKALRAGVPTLVSKAVPTDITVRMAREYDLTLICSAHSDSLKVFSDPLGIVGA